MLVVSGCSIVPFTQETKKEQVAMPEVIVEGVNENAQPVEGKGAVAVTKTKTYTSKEYILSFTYPEAYILEKQSADFKDALVLRRVEDGVDVASIGITSLEDDQWMTDPYDTFSPDDGYRLFVKDEFVVGNIISTYLMSNGQGHLFTVRCVKEECGWVLDSIIFDKSLTNLDTQYFIGDWKVEGVDFEKISLYEDGSYTTFLHDKPLDNGKWNFLETNKMNTLTFTSNSGEELNRSYTVNQGETGGYIMLENGLNVYTWRVIE
ncbi:MAG: hypothetical protein COX81_02565 [Candidatus Magasanikbacteria bacterium CG_4_10_14_0_2_um_filter_37_12]|uniref:Lipoprotein n=1 Tax=Candidatus Magasanikbacteria bacterium CG_4_10_14_0_2_um_filter_37_12 TaxID=1974637 RepID=A0A2M7V7U5_9BACT|nr:MAG: hypothetical protein COX81_02565 [Candidatus Magasanikbacteria bacterium CG_4_10_14_0_2_um_filter_37_12]